MPRTAVLSLPASGIRSWTPRVLAAATAGVPALEIDVTALGTPGLDELAAWRDLALELEHRGVPLRYRGEAPAILLLRLVAGQRLVGDLRLILGAHEVLLCPGDQMDLARTDAGEASAIGRHLRAVPVAVDLEEVGQIGSGMINWLLQLRQQLGVQRLELRNGRTRALVPLRQMGLDHVLDMG